MESALSSLFTKEYHASQMGWSRSVVPALLDGASRCSPLPPIRPDILLHVGIRWNAWHIALPYLDRRGALLRQELERAASVDDVRVGAKIEAELESVFDAAAEMYRQLNELDMFAGVWKGRCHSPTTTVALCLEQQARYADAQDRYTELNMRYAGDVEGGKFSSSAVGRGGRSAKLAAAGTAAAAGRVAVGKAEVCLWEARWIECARELCQWEVLTEFARSCIHSDLLHDCMWRVPEWSALKELLSKHPVEDGPRLKMYESYMRLQENRLDVADSYIQQGMNRALEQYCSMPVGAGPQAAAPVLVQFQQFVELQESSRILAELTALSRQGAANVNVEQKIEALKTILNAWRERLPAPHESLTVWSDVLTWRNHVHSIVVTVLEALKNAANQSVQAAQGQSSSAIAGVGLGKTAGAPGAPQGPVDPAQAAAAAAIVNALTNQQALIMGVNETAWSVHRFARACRKQGLPGVALNALQQMYPFVTMELTEYFVKMKETARSHMACPPGLDNSHIHGLNELNRCNMDHFSPQQKAHVFTMKGQFLKELGLDAEVADSFSTALSTASDVSAAWLAWAQHSDDMHVRASKASGALVASPSAMSGLTDGDDGSPDPALAWREAAANCYLQAVKFGSGKGRMYIPRVLRLLTIDLAARRRRKVAAAALDVVSAPPAAATGGKAPTAAAPAAGTPLEPRPTSHLARAGRERRSPRGRRRRRARACTLCLWRLCRSCHRGCGFPGSRSSSPCSAERRRSRCEPYSFAWGSSTRRPRSSRCARTSRRARTSSVRPGSWSAKRFETVARTLRRCCPRRQLPS
jgi:transformation/transcription domain-associated protein